MRKIAVSLSGTVTAGDRMFEVLVPKKGSMKRSMVYPPVDGNKALKNMETLTKRGFAPVARTEANGITEVLTLDEMKDLPDLTAVIPRSSKDS